MWLIVILLIAVAAILQYSFGDVKSIIKGSSGHEKFVSFQRNWLLVYLLAMGGDWLQGPYVYALYEYYGFSMGEIAALFVGGFGSSMIFGTFVGAVSDKYGRRRMALVFGVLYAFACVTKLVPSFAVLFVGRLAAGIATSLLFSVFESWMVEQHKSNGFDLELLPNTFAVATLGNGLVAIVAGVIAGFVADIWGYVAPFMVAMFILLACAAVVYSTWAENYGDSEAKVSSGLWHAWADLRNDRRIWMLGLVQSLYEGAMYTFVFMWTPALQAAVKLSSPPSEDPGATPPLPFGLIFASFMVCVMIGSGLFSWAVPRTGVSRVGQWTFAIASCALLVPALSTNYTLLLTSFLVFEVSCGLYWPSLGTLRGKHLPEKTRSAIMNFFRIPLNLFVILVLLKAESLSVKAIFFLCSAMLMTAFGVMSLFIKITEEAPEEEEEVQEKEVVV